MSPPPAHPRRRGASTAAPPILAGLPAAAVLSLAALAGCSHGGPSGPGTPAPGAYFARIQPILDRSCIGAGCHGAEEPASGLDLTSWERLMAGSRFGAVVIAFRPEESHLVAHLTGAASSRMPLSRDPLPEAEIEEIRAWIAGGARSDVGEVPFAGARRKLYVVNQGSDLLSVIDGDALVTARLVDLGALPSLEVPHNVHVDRQGRFGYVTLISSGLLGRFDAAADTVAATGPAGIAPAHPITSPDGRTVYVTDWNDVAPALHVLDAGTLALRYSLRFPPDGGSRPHGLAITPDGATLLTVHEGGGSVFKVTVGETPDDALLVRIPLGEPGESTRPFQALLAPGGRLAFVTCSGTGDVRVVDVGLEAVVAVIPVGGVPISGGMSPDGRYVFVANWGKDAVDVIETATLSVTATLSNDGLPAPVFARPHAAAVSADGRTAFVTNENTNGAYPEHHPSEAGGNAGNVAVIDIATMRVVRTIEVEVDPTGVCFVER